MTVSSHTSPSPPRVALVTGATGGIGRAVALRLGAMGMQVAFCGRRRALLDGLQAEFAALEQACLPIEADLRREADILRMFSEVRAAWGGVDVLINNAGLGHKAPLMSGDTAQWREMLDVNVLALCVATREAVSDMQRREVAGHVVHIGSMSGHRVPGGSGVYAASKFAVRALTEGLRQELRAAGSPIRVSSVSPGFVETGFAEVYHGDKQAGRRTYDALQCLQADDIAEAVAWIVGAPPHVQVHDVLLRPTQQQS